MHLSCQKEFLCPDCDSNKPPIANAGADLVIALPKDSVMLDGAASSDADGTIASFKWTKVAGPASSVISNATSSKTIVKALAMGVYEFELTVTDNGGLSEKDTVQIIVNNPGINQPPISNAGNDQTIVLPTDSASLNGSSSFDPDGNIVSYLWSKITGPSSFTIITPNASQTKVKNLIQGVYKFELTASDNGGLSAKDTVDITVNTTSTNLPPVAEAGAFVSINYDLLTCKTNPSSVTLSGNASTDPDGTIVSFLWTGPGTITNATSAVCQISNLLPGLNTFTLTVSDNKGEMADDTVSINVTGSNRNIVSAQFVSVGTLSQARAGVTIGSAGNKILFAGGQTAYTERSSRVDIYDKSTNTWSTAELSQARTGMGTATLGTKIYFAGGNLPSGLTTTRIDIYDVVTNSWSTAELSVSRQECNVEATGNKVLFAGGFYQPVPGNIGFTDRVDILNTSTNSWSVSALSEARVQMASCTFGNKIYFAGGNNHLNGTFTSRIDIYDVVSNSWTNSSISKPRSAMGTIASGNKIYWAGGQTHNDSVLNYTLSNLVEIRDINTQSSSFACLSRPDIFWQNAVVQNNNKIAFYNYHDEPVQRLEIYDITTNTWSIGIANQTLPYYPSIYGAGNSIYVAGGGYSNGTPLSNQVWRLDF